MSYSFYFRAKTKPLAKQAARQKLDEVITYQPVHASDRAAILANADAVIDLLADDDTRDICVTMNGYVSWGNAAGEEPAFHTVQISSSATYVVSKAEGV